ncbi:MAG: iron uptake porin [Cyanophyceae cyanobacterium]
MKRLLNLKLGLATLAASVGVFAAIAPEPARADQGETAEFAEFEATELEGADAEATDAESSVEYLQEVTAVPGMEQVTSVSQLSDVSPTDWAFQALQSLVERYGCIAGYPDGTYRGNRALTRYEFAAGLNACLDRVNELIAASTDPLATKEDLQTLQRLQEEFAAELAEIRGRVDALEARTSELEANQFSTTTKLVGEVVFNLADSFTDDDDSQTVFAHRVRLQLVSSFTGKDKLLTRLTTGNIGNSFASEIGTNEGRFAFDGPGDNTFRLDRLHYVFPVGDQLTVYAMASLGGHHFYIDTMNTGLEAGGGANGALSRFGERNPIFRLGLGGQGVGLKYKLSDVVTLNAGYLARGGNDPAEGRGLFNGNYSAMGHIKIQPSSSFKFGLTYIHGYDPRSTFALGGTGTGLGNLNTDGIDLDTDEGVRTNTFGVNALWDISPKVSLRGWFGYIDADFVDDGSADVLTYAGVLALKDLFVEGNFGYVLFGAAPYLSDADGDSGFESDVPLHLEAAYKVQVSDNITITPGFIWLFSPQQDSDNDDIVIGSVRTTFSF